MRCRKARSFLSAYCNEELSGRKAQAVSEHIATCSDCRREEAFYQSLRESGRTLTGLKVSADFNAKLLNRVAQERFSETRRKAYLPRRAPVVAWGRLLPVAAAACVFLLVGTVSFDYLANSRSNQSVVDPGADDSYLTAQPRANLHREWSLAAQLAKADRVARISSAMTPTESFGGMYGNPVSASVSSVNGRVPFADEVQFIRPVIKVYVAPNQTSTREVDNTY